MALINITPTMTSNTTPSPYVVGASSIYSSTFPAYKAFNGTNIDSNDAWLANGTTGAIVIDFGSEVSTKAFEIVSRYEIAGYSTTAPKTFELYGSNVSMTTGFELLYSSRDEILWNSNESRLFQFDSSHLFRYYKLIITSNNGHAQACGVGLLKFYKDDGITPVEDSKTVSRRYTLPFGSRARLNSLTSDLTYMLATESDGENEGTLRIVNHAGKFIVPKAGQKKVTIWKGYANNISTSLILSDPITKFSSIIIKYSQWTQSNPSIMYVQLPIVDGKISGNIMLVTGSDARYMDISFTTDFNITFNQLVNTGTTTNIGIMEVIGIY